MPFRLLLEDVEHRIRDSRERAVFLTGPVGVGKTDLLQELATAQRDRGRVVYEGAGASVTSSEPFASLAHLLPDLDPGGDPNHNLHEAHRTLVNNPMGQRPVFIVDDAHLLDHWSAVFLHQAVIASSAFLVAAVPRSIDPPGDLGALLDAHGVRTIEMRALSDTDAADFIQRLLAGPIDAFAMTEFIRLSGGNPAWIRRLVADARERRSLELVDGLWQSTGALVDPTTASEIAAGFLTTLNENEIELLDLLAIAGTLELSVVEQLSDLEMLEALEAAGFLHVDPLCPTSTTALASDAVRELLSRRMTQTRRIRLRRRLADVVPAGVADGTDEPPPTWLLETGQLTEPAHYEHAARLALANGDFLHAERFASDALRKGGGAAAQVLRAEALVSLGRIDDANNILAAVATTAAEDAHVAQATLAQMRHARWLTGAPSDATQIGETAVRKLESADWRDAISAELALHAGLQGDYTGAAGFAATVLNRQGAADRAKVEAAIVSSQALVMLGRLDEADEVIRAATPLVPRLAAQLPTARAMLDFVEFQLHLWKGQISAADDFNRTRLAEALDRRVPGWFGLWTLTGATVKLMRGEVIEAAREYCAALGNLASFDPLRVLPVGQAWRALAEVQAGMLRAAQTTLDNIAPEYIPGEFRIASLRLGVEAWMRAQSADTDNAAQLSRKAGRELIDHTHVVWGAYFLHHAARFNRGTLVAAELAEVAEVVDSPFVNVMSMHALAVAERDVDLLLRVTTMFSDMGAFLLAAEAAAQAATLLGRRNAPTAAARATVRAAHLAGLAKGADTPALRQLDVFLTPREQGIARLAIEGLTSREISQALSISTRTVDNHLGSVYVKLGIHGRTELASVMNGGSRSGSAGAADTVNRPRPPAE